jgi:hypothetical protein
VKFHENLAKLRSEKEFLKFLAEKVKKLKKIFLKNICVKISERKIFCEFFLTFVFF